MTATLLDLDPEDDTSYTAPAACDAARITYRQLDHWTRRGYLAPDRDRPGTGYPRRFPEHEVRIAAAMKRLIDRGHSPASAANLARGGAADRELTIDLGDGLGLIADADLWALA